MRVFAWALGAALAVAGCGGRATQRQTDWPDSTTTTQEAARPAGPVTESGSNEVRATVGSPGGTLSLSNGARLEIPQGALSEDTEVVFAIGHDGQAFGDAETQRPLGPMLKIEPAMMASGGAGLVISIPRLAIPSGFEESDLAFAMEEVGDQRAIDTLATQTRWQNYPVHVEGDRFVARVEGVPGQRVHFGVAR